MAQRRKFRGVSIGTIVMLLMTCAVLLGMGVVLPKLSSNTLVTIDTDKVLQALSLGSGLPELSLSDIPISVTQQTKAPYTQAPQTTAQPDATPRPTQAPTATPEPTPTPGGRFTATFGGSVIINTDLRQEHYFKESKKYDFTEVLTLLRSELTADFSMVTLENIIYSEAKLSDTVTTDAVVPMLGTVGIDAAALGYRNAFDQGYAGLQSTIAAVQAQGITALGAYADQAQAGLDRRIMELGGVKVALLHYTDVLSDKGKKAIKKDNASFAMALDAVSNGADAVLADIAEVRQQGADVVVVSLSWGTSGKTAPTQKQKAFAQQLADAGADVIIGAGSRVVQPAVWLTGNLADGSTKQVLCAYSLGSLFNGGRSNANVAGMLLHVDITYDGDRVSFNRVSYTPTYIWRYKQDGRYYYRVVASDLPAPDGMSDSQIESKDRAFTNVKKQLGKDSPLELR